MIIRDLGEVYDVEGIELPEGLYYALVQVTGTHHYAVRIYKRRKWWFDQHIWGTSVLLTGSAPIEGSTDEFDEHIVSAMKYAHERYLDQQKHQTFDEYLRNL